MVINSISSYQHMSQIDLDKELLDTHTKLLMEELENSTSYYSVLGVSSDSSDDEIRRAYRKLAMQWHPDKWTRSPSLLGKAKRKFQQIQEAYSVLSDRSKRLMYDSGFYDPHEEEEEGFADFLQEMMSLMDNVKKEGKTYSMAELQSMFQDMAKCFEETREWSSYTHDFCFNSSQSYHPQSFAFGNTSSGSMNWQNGGQSSSYTHDFSLNSSQCYHPQTFAFSNTSYGSMNWHNGGQSSANFVRRRDGLY